MAQNKMVKQEAQITHDVHDVRKIVVEEKICIGTENTIKNLRLGKLGKVIITSNCPKGVKEDINSLNRKEEGEGAEIINIPENNEELGIICRKPFHVSVLGVIRK